MNEVQSTQRLILLVRRKYSIQPVVVSKNRWFYGCKQAARQDRLVTPLDNGVDTEERPQIRFVDS
jgi:hypothetical protein